MSANRRGFLDEEIVGTATKAADVAAARLASEIRAAARARGRCLVALSGGRSPAAMFRALAHEHLPWELVHLFQVDERDAPDGHPDRNWTHLHADLIARVALRPEQLHPAPVPSAGDLEAAARRYAQELESLAGYPPILDLIHLGLGCDGHTASLMPGDPALDVCEASVCATRTHGGHRRMTFTFPTLNVARRVLWFVVGAEKREALRRLCAGDRSLPAACVARERATLVCDSAAAGEAS